MVSKSYDPGSVYGYDPDTGIAREMPEVEPARVRPYVGDPELTTYPCHGCGERMRPGDVTWETVQAAGHVISVPCHDQHRAAARASALEDRSWQGRGDTSHSAR